MTLPGWTLVGETFWKWARETVEVFRRGIRSAALLALAALCVPLARAHSAVAASTRCLVRGAGKPLDEIWRPHMLAAIGYTDTRRGDVAFAVRTEDRFYGYRPDHTEGSFRRSDGESGRSRPRGGSCTSKGAGDTALACSTTRWRCWCADARASRSPC